MYCSEDLVFEILAKATIKILSPLKAIVDVRDKNIKERKAGVDPLQFNYKKI